MSTTKHTPGPLHIGDGKRTLIVYRADGYAVADCKTFHGKIGQDEAEANAVLFAAAPELLAALQALFRQTVTMRLQPDANCLQMVAAAIAKAEGRS